MNSGITYDVAIAGGGLAGLCLSIQCAKAGLKTILVEKETYPFHRVCGEYISLESRDLLIKLGLKPIVSVFKKTFLKSSRITQSDLVEPLSTIATIFYNFI